MNYASSLTSCVEKLFSYATYGKKIKVFLWKKNQYVIPCLSWQTDLMWLEFWKVITLPAFLDSYEIGNKNFCVWLYEDVSASLLVHGLAFFIDRQQQSVEK